MGVRQKNRDAHFHIKFKDKYFMHLMELWKNEKAY